VPGSQKLGGKKTGRKKGPGKKKGGACPFFFPLIPIAGEKAQAIQNGD
jgi:hypothetical protein